LGVHWSRARGKWVASIGDGRTTRYLGSYGCELEAARSYDSAAREYFGEFAKPNFATQRECENV
jgi:hypothetical protein